MIALDSTGIKVVNRGEWIRHKWHIRKGYLKIYVAVDIKRKRILSLEVTSEEVHDGMMLRNLVDAASENNNVKGVLADGMYDSNKNFRYLSKHHIKPGRSEAVPRLDQLIVIPEICLCLDNRQTSKDGNIA